MRTGLLGALDMMSPIPRDGLDTKMAESLVHARIMEFQTLCTRRASTDKWSTREKLHAACEYRKVELSISPDAHLQTVLVFKVGQL